MFDKIDQFMTDLISKIPILNESYVYEKEKGKPGREYYIEGGLKRPKPGFISPLADEYTPKGQTKFKSVNIESPQEAVGPLPSTTSVSQPVFNNRVMYDYFDKPPVPLDLRSLIEEAANIYGIDPSVLASLVSQETGGFGYKPVRGTSGERGITQIIPKYHYQPSGLPVEEYGSRLEEDPAFALNESARILSRLYNAYDQNYRQALAGYNAGGNFEAGYPYADMVLGRLGR